MDKQRIRIEQHGGFGLIWLGGWLFTVGYLDFGVWRGLAALVLWPYFLGVEVAADPVIAVPAPAPG